MKTAPNGPFHAYFDQLSQLKETRPKTLLSHVRLLESDEVGGISRVLLNPDAPPEYYPADARDVLVAVATRNNVVMAAREAAAYVGAMVGVDRHYAFDRERIRPCALLYHLDERCRQSRDGEDDMSEADDDALDPDVSESEDVDVAGITQSITAGELTVVERDLWDADHRAALLWDAYRGVLVLRALVVPRGVPLLDRYEVLAAKKREAEIEGVVASRLYWHRVDTQRDCDPMGWHVGANLRYALRRLAGRGGGDAAVITLRTSGAVEGTAGPEKIRNRTTVHLRATETPEPFRKENAERWAAALLGVDTHARAARWSQLRWRLALRSRDEDDLHEKLAQHLYECLDDPAARVDGLEFWALATAAKAALRKEYRALARSAVDFAARADLHGDDAQEHTILACAAGFAAAAPEHFVEELKALLAGARDFEEYKDALALMAGHEALRGTAYALPLLARLRDREVSQDARREAQRALAKLLRDFPAASRQDIDAFVALRSMTVDVSVEIAQQLREVGSLGEITRLLAVNPARPRELRDHALGRLQVLGGWDAVIEEAKASLAGPPRLDSVIDVIERIRELLCEAPAETVLQDVTNKLSEKFSRSPEPVIALFCAFFGVAQTAARVGGASGGLDTSALHRVMRGLGLPEPMRLGRAQYYQRVADIRDVLLAMHSSTSRNPPEEK